MKQPVLITVNSSFHTDEGDDSSEFFTEGILALKNGKYYLIYDTVYDDGNTIKTTLIAHHTNKITLKNSGDTSYSLSLEENVRSTNLVSFGGLEMMLGVQPNRICCELAENGHGSILMIYYILNEGEILSENTIQIQVRPKN